MSSRLQPGRPVIFTIGHSNHPSETFLKLLTDHNIDVVVNARTSPYSGSTPCFNKDNLQDNKIFQIN